MQNRFGRGQVKAAGRPASGGKRSRDLLDTSVALNNGMPHKDHVAFTWLLKRMNEKNRSRHRNTFPEHGTI